MLFFFSFILIIVQNKAATNTSWKAKNTKCSFLRACDRREAVLEVKNTFAQFRCIQLGRDVIALRNVLNHFLSCVAVRLCVTKGNSSTIILPFHFAPKNIGLRLAINFVTVGSEALPTHVNRRLKSRQVEPTIMQFLQFFVALFFCAVHVALLHGVFFVFAYSQEFRVSLFGDVTRETVLWIFSERCKITAKHVASSLSTQTSRGNSKFPIRHGKVFPCLFRTAEKTRNPLYSRRGRLGEVGNVK